MKAYLIPGNGEDLKSREYGAVLKLYKDLGYEPEFVLIDWKYKTIDDWVGQVLRKLSKRDIQKSLLSGFSFGSMIALAVAADANPKQLLLFSLSPYFKEDFPIPDDYEKWAGKRRIENFRRLSMNDLAAKVGCPTKIFIGRKEMDKYTDMDERSSQACTRIKNSKLIVIDGVGHDVGHPKYIEAIRKELE